MLGRRWEIRTRIRYGVDVGPFRVSGLDYAIERLGQIFSVLSGQGHDEYSQIKTAGMLCVRRIKFNPAHYSNHSWGTAIDLYFGSPGKVDDPERIPRNL